MYEITYVGHGYDPARSSAYVQFIVNVEGERRRLVVGYLDDFLCPSSDATTSFDALAGFVISRIHQLAEASPGEFATYTTEGLIVVLDADDVRAAFSRSEKNCSWRVESRGAPFCEVPSPTDDSVRLINGAALAPTTSGLCGSCTVPDVSLRCRALVHPQVTVVRAAEGGVIRRVVTEVYCEAGYSPGDGGQCRPGGQDCWRISWRPAPPVAEAMPPQAIHEAFDFLSLQWKASLGIELFAGLPIEALGGLAAPVTDRDTFKARMSDLAAVIERMLSGAAKPASTPEDDWKGSLNRVEAVLTDAGIEPPSAAIRVLRDIVAVRTGLQHPGSRDLEKVLTGLGVPMPVSDWTQAWRAVQHRVVEAVTQLRVTLRDR